MIMWWSRYIIWFLKFEYQTVMNLIGNIKKSITYYWCRFNLAKFWRLPSYEVYYCGFEVHMGQEVGQLASQKICHISQRFCEAWPSNQVQLKSCSLLNGKAPSSTMDCSRLCTTSAGHLVIVVSGTGVSYWQFCACMRDNSSPPSDDAVCTHAPQKSCVGYSIVH
jgi:hypothetical protein